MLIQKEGKILRQIAAQVIDIKSPEIRSVIKRMSAAMFNEPDGIGIAAPQIGESLQIFLVAKDLLSLSTTNPRESVEIRKRNYMVFINPKITKLSQQKESEIEGCLSVRKIYGEVRRSEKLILDYYDENEMHHKRGMSGLFARVIQHEVDHLNGTLFIDKAKNLKTLNT